MKKTYKPPLPLISISILIIFLAQLACGLSAAKQPTATVRRATRSQPTQAAANAPTQGPPKNNAGNNPAMPTEILTTSTPKPDPIQLVAQGYGQSSQEVGYSFIVANPNKNFAFEASQYHITAYGAAGAVVDTESGYMELILPGQTVGVGGDLFVDEGITVTSVEVQVISGDAQATDLSTAFTVNKAKYKPSESFPEVTGIITNPYNMDIHDVRVSAVLYDQAGKIIGGGYTYVSFILANGKTGVSFNVASAGQVNKVELYATVSSLTNLTASDELPDGAQNLTVTKQGFGQHEAQVGYGALIHNPNSGFAVENTWVHVNFYDADGNIIYVDEENLDTLLPSQSLGVGGNAYIGPDVTVASMDFQLKSGSYTSSVPVPPFTATNISYVADPDYPKVTGEIVSPYDKDVTNIRVSAVAYNAAGEIIGGGYTYLDFIPANDKMAVEISVVVSGTPATIELYAGVSSLSEFK